MMPPHIRNATEHADTGDGGAPQQQAGPIERALGTEARQIVKSIRIPADGKLNDDLRAKIRDLVSRHMSEHKLTQREIALAIGRAANTLSQVLSNTYAGDTDAVLKLLNQYVEDDERRRRTARPIGFFPTSVFDSILLLAKYAKSNARVRSGERKTHDASRIALGYGPAGCGKSIGADAYHADDPASILIRIKAGTQKAAGFVRQLGHKLGIPHAHGLHRNMEAIESKLTDSGRLLIVDEAHRLHFSACECIRDLADVCGIPILLLGTQEVSQRLTKVRQMSGNMMYDQFASRVGMQLDLVKGLDGRGGASRPIYSIDEIRAIFRAGEIRLSKAAEEWLQAIACTSGEGMLRTAQNVYEKVYRSYRKKHGVLVTFEDVERATSMTLFAAGTEVKEVMDRIRATHKACREMASHAEARAATG